MWPVFNEWKSGRHINSVIICPLADFSWGRDFNVTPAGSGGLKDAGPWTLPCES